MKHVKDIWLSIYNEQALKKLKKNHIRSYHSQMSILIQHQVKHVISFKLVSNLASNEVEVDINIGINTEKGKNFFATSEDLPWRQKKEGQCYKLIFSKQTQDSQIETFSNKSYALYQSNASQNQPSSFEWKRIDYSKTNLSQDPNRLISLANQLGKIVLHLESENYDWLLDQRFTIDGCVCQKSQKVYLFNCKTQMVE